MTGADEESGRERRDRIREALQNRDLDALVCVLPSNVLLTSGYWPVVGTSLSVSSRAGEIAVLVPKDELELAERSWAGEIIPYAPGSLRDLRGPVENIIDPLSDCLHRLGAVTGPIGYEHRPIYEGSSYSATFRFQSVIAEVLGAAAPSAAVVSADPVLDQLRYSLTPQEVAGVRAACELVGHAYEHARSAIEPGRHEFDIASACMSSMQTAGLSRPAVNRAGTYAWCMSGPNSAKAGGAFARTTGRKIETGDLVLVHSNPYVDGYFGDVTRTYSVGQPSATTRPMFVAVLEARQSALDAIKPGVAAVEVDRAAREVLTQHGYGQYFTHGVGHSVGFSVISGEFPPRLHPASLDVLESGCTFNLEPSIYVEGLGGIRHCDVVTMTDDGYELLTPFQSTLEELVV